MVLNKEETFIFEFKRELSVGFPDQLSREDKAFLLAIENEKLEKRRKNLKRKILREGRETQPKAKDGAKDNPESSSYWSSRIFCRKEATNIKVKPR